MFRSIIRRLKRKSNTQNPVKKTSNSSNEPPVREDELLHRHRMENTPFDIVGNGEKGYFAALGRFKITENMQSPAHVEDYVNSNLYNIVLLILQILIPEEIKHQLKERDREFMKGLEQQPEFDFADGGHKI